MALETTSSRRNFILAGTATGGGLLLGGLASAALAEDKAADQLQKDNAAKAEEISPAEDLMREHGVLLRILLIYNETAARLMNNSEFDITTLASTAKIVRKFVEDYHSKLEEDQVFPRFEKAGKLVDLVKLLRQQHDVGRKITDKILQICSTGNKPGEQDRQTLINAMWQFTRMYPPHIGREDTVVFAALRTVVKPEEYDVMGDKFEDQEHKLFGENGFENLVEQVADIEKKLGIYDLAKFTAKI